MTQPTPEAIKFAKASALKWGIPASVELAQWALESGWGKRMSGKNNPFGITAPLNGQGRPLVPATAVHTHEDGPHGKYATTRYFRDFDSLGDAFDYHARLLATSSYYKQAMAALPSLTRFIALMAPHYASDRNYAKLLWSVINGSNLTQYDGVKS